MVVSPNESEMFEDFEDIHEQEDAIETIEDDYYAFLAIDREVSRNMMFYRVGSMIDYIKTTGNYRILSDVMLIIP